LTNSLPKFTIVIPTRERSDTLSATLKTCITQDYSNLEIIVSDNYSQDQTKDVVESFSDERIRYINTGKRVGMAANWEFALSHVSDGYVSYIGDDDGFLPGAISKIADILQELANPPVFAWGRAVYKWPNYSLVHERNSLFLHTDQRLLRLESDKSLRLVANLKSPWASLPSIYNGFINMEVIRKIIESGNGHFFNSAIPDVYSAFVIAAAVPEYHFSMRPFAVAGLSAKSTGSSFSNITENDKPAQLFLEENEISIHPRVVMSSLSVICATECLLQAQDLKLIPEDIHVDMKKVINAALLEASEEPRNEYKIILTQLREIGRRNGLESFVEDAIQHAMHSPRLDYPLKSARYIRRRGILFNCADFQIKDVYDASILCEQIITYGPSKYRFLFGTIYLTILSSIPFFRKRIARIVKWLQQAIVTLNVKSPKGTK
jgi:glycosyltransferase involved in cell wall biosynthesis